MADLPSPDPTPTDAGHDLWFKNAVIYQLHVRSFQDSNGDGIGDFRGLISRLDHFSDLGVTAIWLLPFYVSPLRDDGYDIEDYCRVNPMYGDVADVREFLELAHARGLKVITELVLNHTSDQHPWFQRARRAAAGSPERDYYVWSDTPERYQQARIIFQDFEPSNWTWDPVAEAYFWHRFYSHQPDLNFDNPLVREELFRVMDFWMEMGVDGVRLDAVPYLYERDGTNGENLPETHAFLKELRRHVDSKFRNRMLLAEANQWPEDAAAYFGDGDECHMNFHFPLMPRLFMTIQMEDRYPLVEILQQTPEIPRSCQWGIFLRNHDELTLEMVTDEERDFMNRVYATDRRARINLGIRRRLAPLMGNDRKKIELIHSLLFSMPGTPVLYYGDEIGMGDNVALGDRNGVRTPMQWSADRNAGFSTAPESQLFLPLIADAPFHHGVVNVSAARANGDSLLNWTRRMLQVRGRHRAFATGELIFLHPENAKVVAFLRRLDDEVLLVIANLSRFTQHAALDLSAHAGAVPVEMFGLTRLPRLQQGLTPFTLAPYAFMWFALDARQAGSPTAAWEPPLLSAGHAWTRQLRHAIERQVLPAYLGHCRWFGGKGRELREVTIANETLIPGTEVRLLEIEVAFLQERAERYAMPVAVIDGAQARQWLAEMPAAVLARLDESHVLCDALRLPEFAASLFGMMTGLSSVGQPLRLRGGPNLSADAGSLRTASSISRVLSGEQSNTNISFADTWLLKFYRKFETGEHTDVELTEHLSARGFPVPAFVSALELAVQGEGGLLAMLTNYCQHQGDGWTYTLDALGRYFERVGQSLRENGGQLPIAELAGGVYPERAAQLGRTTAQMHTALSQAGGNEAFQPQPFTSYYRRSIYQAMRSRAQSVLRELRRHLHALPPPAAELATRVLDGEPRIIDRFHRLLRTDVRCDIIRVHGDFHLGQVLNTGQEWLIIDFEGEPRRPLTERRLRRSALHDVAGMVRSLDYAACEMLARLPEEEQPRMAPWAAGWTALVTSAYLDAYFETATRHSFVPSDALTAKLLLDLLVLDKAVYEIGYELNYRPHKISIPLAAVHRLADAV